MLDLNAQLMLPRMLARATTAETGTMPPPAASPEGKVLAEMRRWRYQYTAAAIDPSVFTVWYNDLVKRL